MIIAQISDTHIDPDNPSVAARSSDLERCVAHINGLDPLPKVVIHTGDMTHNGTPVKYTEAVRVLSALRPPLYIAAGNRDDRALIRANFPVGRNLLPGTPFVHYCVDDFPVRLIALDTLSENTNMGDFCDVRADSLGRALAEDTVKPTVLFMHHPPFEVRESKYRWQYESQDAIARMSRVLEGQGHVVRAFSGHAHRDSAGLIAHVAASSVPSVAIDLRLGDFPEAAEAAPVFQLHTYKGGQGFVTETRAAA